MLPTRCGKNRGRSLKHGLNLKLSVQHIVGQETTSHCIWITRRFEGFGSSPDGEARLEIKQRRVPGRRPRDIVGGLSQLNESAAPP